ncbi:MAG TPA: MFS transporter [Solirubrobacteraceae bacterium]|nr:MFS transporter [Solirubrobacteraceae bacterium]
MNRESVPGDAGPSWLGAFDDEVRMTRPRRRALLAIGLGEFVDAYDLIVISGALLVLKPHFHLSAGELGWLSAAAFFGSAVGALFFGDLTDRIGRRRVFVLNLVAFVGLALVSAVVTEVWMLFVVRVLIGVAIGADIVASISFLAELSPKGSRGGWTGAMPQVTWSLGAICSVLVGAGLYALVGAESWRLMFALGAVPAVAVLQLRRSLPDSPRWLLSQGRIDDAVGVFEQFGVRVLDRSRLVNTTVPGAPVVGMRARVRDWLAPYGRLFAGPRRAAVVFSILMIGLIPLNGIAQSVLGPYVLNEFGHLSKVGSLLGGSVIWIGAVVGSCLAWVGIDRIGRMWSAVAALIGFVVVYVLWATVAYGTTWLIPLFCALGVVTWWGAAALWPLPSELAPTAVRGHAQGLGSGLQRFSIGINVLFIPHMLVWVGFRTTLIVAAAISVALIPLALWGRRFEPARKSLEVASGDELLTAVADAAAVTPADALTPVPGP